MQGFKGILLTALFMVMAGAAIGLIQSWSELVSIAYPGQVNRATYKQIPISQSKNTDVEQSTKTSIQISEDTADIKELLTLTPPAVDANENEWKKFLYKLNTVDTGKRYSNSGQTSPLLAWYAYIAKYRPQVLYAELGSREFDNRKFNHLLQMGFLLDWADSVEDKDKLFIGNYQALLNYAMTFGQEAAKERVINSFFNKFSNQLNSATIEINLNSLRFASSAMSPEQIHNIMPILLEGNFKIEPRSIHNLALIPSIDPDDLLRLMHKHAYDSRSMSSFMTTGALLGDAGYVASMVEDVQHNSKQPTNFYCSLCGLALSADGLLGNPLVKTSEANDLVVSRSEKYGFILSSETNFWKKGKENE